MTPHYLCIDIGGTKLCAGRSDGHRLWNITEVPIHKGIPDLLTQLQRCIQTNGDTVSAILIGCPGNIIDDQIVAGSAQNLGTFPGEFDGFNLRQSLAPHTTKPIAVFNDAQAQMAGAYRDLHDTLTGVTAIGYIGPGTGLGGGFARVGEGCYHPVTDGHIFDISLAVPTSFLTFPASEGAYGGEASKPKSFLAFGEKGKKLERADTLSIPPSLGNKPTDTAENLLSGRAFYTRTGLSAVEAAKTDPSKYKKLIDEFGYTLANLIRDLHTGSISKPDAHAWSSDDIAFVRTVTDYLIGGGLGTSSPFGDWLLASARAYLQNWAIPVALHPIPDTRRAALVGVVMLYISLNPKKTFDQLH
jgi:hypothetical protein